MQRASSHGPFQISHISLTEECIEAYAYTSRPRKLPNVAVGTAVDVVKERGVLGANLLGVHQGCYEPIKKECRSINLPHPKFRSVNAK
jgi:hypothetical protein